jgi:hypothetical protein
VAERRAVVVPFVGSRIVGVRRRFVPPSWVAKRRTTRIPRVTLRAFFTRLPLRAFRTLRTILAIWTFRALFALLALLSGQALFTLGTRITTAIEYVDFPVAVGVFRSEVGHTVLIKVPAVENGAIGFAITTVGPRRAYRVLRTHPAIIADAVKDERSATRILAALWRNAQSTVKAVRTRLASVVFRVRTAVLTDAVETCSTRIHTVLGQGPRRVERGRPLANHLTSRLERTG